MSELLLALHLVSEAYGPSLSQLQAALFHAHPACGVQVTVMDCDNLTSLCTMVTPVGTSVWL